MDEDNVACEKMQTTAGQIDGPPLYGASEQRVGWFDEVYADAVDPR